MGKVLPFVVFDDPVKAPETPMPAEVREAFDRHLEELKRLVPDAPTPDSKHQRAWDRMQDEIYTAIHPGFVRPGSKV